MKLSDSEAAYIAGFIDGEGTINVLNTRLKRTKRGQFTVHITIDQVDPRPMIWMHSKVGGSLFAKTDKRPNHRPMTRWVIGGAACEDLLRRVLPYLINKHDKANIALAMRESLNAGYCTKYPVPEEEYQRRLRLVASAKAESL